MAVMLGPKAVSSGEQPRNAPARSWALATSSSVCLLVSYGAPMLALSLRR